MDQSDFLERLKKILDTDALTVEQEISPITWDSIEVLGTIALLDKAGKAVTIADIQNCRSVGDLMQLAGTR